MKKFSFLTALGAMITMTLSAATVNYTPDNTSIFSNPERGFTEELGGETMLSNSNNHVIQKEASWFFTNSRSSYASLLVAIYYFGNYRDSDLSSQILQGFNDDMQILRNKGYKCVLRFAYDWDSCNDAPKAKILRHIEQLKPYLAANADVIYALETGFVGQWGEWYYTKNFGNYCDDDDDPTQHIDDDRRAVIAAMLDACPADRFLLVRYPMIKTDYFGSSTALTSTQAFSGTDRARMGHHNDAFLNDYGDNGTYASDNKSDDPAVRQYIADETLYVPNGGETNVESKSRAQKMYKQAEAEMSTYHWSFCGESYAEQMTSRWDTSGIKDNLNRNMGYRYQLTTATLPSQAAAGSSVNVKLNIKNVGYAPLYNERHAYIVLKNGNNTYSIQLQSDPRRWLPNNVVTAIDENITIPSNVPAGTYQMYLHMPDKYASLASNPRYSVRFANTGVWDATTGMNSLNASINITNGGTPDPDPIDPDPDPVDPTPSAFAIDGNFNDWANLTNLAHVEVPSGVEKGALYDMRWYANETDIYYYMEYDAATVYLDILLSTDANSATGYDSWMWTNSGAEYLIEGEPDSYESGAWLAVFDNTQEKDDWDNGWKDSDIEDYQTVCSPVTLSNGHKAIEGKISQAKLSTITELRVGAFTMDADWAETGVLPQGNGGADVEMLEVPILKTATILQNMVDSTTAARKVLRNGQLIIIRDNKEYNALGAHL